MRVRIYCPFCKRSGGNKHKWYCMALVVWEMVTTFPPRLP